MRKTKLQVQMSVNGCIAGKNDEMDWMIADWDDALKAYIDKLTATVDTILLGRNMTDGFMSYWSSVSVQPDHPEYAFAKKLMDTPKIVFSRTLEESKWENTVLAKGDFVEVIQALKKKAGKDIIVYGGATFDASLIQKGLIDEYYLFVNPAVIGEGKSIFSMMDHQMKLKLVESVSFECGVVLLRYEAQQERGESV